MVLSLEVIRGNLDLIQSKRTNYTIKQTNDTPVVLVTIYAVVEKQSRPRCSGEL